ncbi:uncharacterized protein [Rhodnius prolixus]|uniref:uncharacterized protein n=1 Tax=Rhodnius prolixus TaxID=13249 RepID=UPI003D187A4B
MQNHFIKNAFRPEKTKNDCIKGERLAKVVQVRPGNKTKIHKWHQLSEKTNCSTVQLPKGSYIRDVPKGALGLEDVDRKEWDILDTKLVSLFKPKRQVKQQNTQADGFESKQLRTVQSQCVKKDVGIEVR